MRTIEDALNRLRAEFLEMPGMHLKPEQVERLCGVERGLCQTVLDSLVDAKFLSRECGWTVRSRHRWRDVQSSFGKARPLCRRGNRPSIAEESARE